MTRQNIIPIENKKPVEEVRYWDYENKELTQEPSLKKEKIITEKDFFISCPLHDGDKKVAKGIGWAGAAGVGVLTFFCPPVGIAFAGTCATTAAVAGATNYVAKNVDGLKNKNVEEGAEILTKFFGISSLGAVATTIRKK